MNNYKTPYKTLFTKTPSCIARTKDSTGSCFNMHICRGETKTPNVNFTWPAWRSSQFPETNLYCYIVPAERPCGPCVGGNSGPRVLQRRFQGSGAGHLPCKGELPEHLSRLGRLDEEAGMACFGAAILSHPHVHAGQQSLCSRGKPTSERMQWHADFSHKSQQNLNQTVKPHRPEKHIR